ncbi:MAG: ABC transporter permease [Rhodospirillales bacterium]|jgi:peptide/nickel transport system permease protein|nr:peptide ABC transporter permease [Rhodospirillaceae bacterium]MDP6427223.1 ABC transporter permease [Rhodospirillales bacterium]MDP6645419.1 ABC transporter permease [Rhodospirillales bacterium]MDP6843880.1 ABC transporter permease [Rhodospirillales bacterium]|tara:strand:+ start:2372 stop:3316 length:945 start_codon:yes stop_codon:yes gene_type:complete
MTASEQASAAIDGTPAADAEQVDIFEVYSPTPYELMKRRARSHPGFLIGSAVVFAVFIVAVFADFIAPFDPFDQNISRRLINPIWGKDSTWINPLGTDAFGRDYLSRVIHGARVSMIVGIVAPLIAACIGSIIGMVGGYFGGRVDAVVMYLINSKLALPGLVVALSLVAVFGGEVFVLVLVLAFLFWDRYAIVLRTVTQQIRAQEFVTAAEAVGCSVPRIIFGEILPNVMNQIIVILTLEMAIAILIEATLSFLGLGIQPPTPTWGNLIAEGRNFMFFKPYLVTIPGICLFFLAIAINMMGDGIRDITAPEGRN